MMKSENLDGMLVNALTPNSDASHEFTNCLVQNLTFTWNSSNVNILSVTATVP